MYNSLQLGNSLVLKLSYPKNSFSEYGLVIVQWFEGLTEILRCAWPFLLQELTVAVYDHLRVPSHRGCRAEVSASSNSSHYTPDDRDQTDGTSNYQHSSCQTRAESEKRHGVKNHQGCDTGRTDSKVSTKMHVLGVDLDETLIKRSQDANPYPANITFRVADVMKEEHQRLVLEPYLRENGKNKFDLVTCFSVTLWIHLNHGDAGLKDFLRYVSDMCHFLIIEPQPWKCYRTATRRMRKLKCPAFEHYDKLAWRENVDEGIVKYLTVECGMTLLETFGQTEWDRTVCILENKTPDQQVRLK